MIDNTYGSAYVGGRLASAFQLTLALLFSGSVLDLIFNVLVFLTVIHTLLLDQPMLVVVYHQLSNRH